MRLATSSDIEALPGKLGWFARSIGGIEGANVRIGLGVAPMARVCSRASAAIGQCCSRSCSMRSTKSVRAPVPDQMRSWKASALQHSSQHIELTILVIQSQCSCAPSRRSPRRPGINNVPALGHDCPVPARECDTAPRPRTAQLLDGTRLTIRGQALAQIWRQWQLDRRTGPHVRRSCQEQNHRKVVTQSFGAAVVVRRSPRQPGRQRS